MRVAPPAFDYHLVWQGQIVDRATNERVARHVCGHAGDILGPVFEARVVEIVHVPTDTVIASYLDGEPLPREAAA